MQPTKPSCHKKRLCTLCECCAVRASPHKGQAFIAHCYAAVERTDLYPELQQLPADDDISVLIGPEGDFSIDEVKQAVAKGYKSITLGNSRLRTETAALMAVAMANLAKRK